MTLLLATVLTCAAAVLSIVDWIDARRFRRTR